MGFEPTLAGFTVRGFNQIKLQSPREPSPGIEPSSPLYKSGASPAMLRRHGSQRRFYTPPGIDETPKGDGESDFSQPRTRVVSNSIPRNQALAASTPASRTLSYRHSLTVLAWELSDAACALRANRAYPLFCHTVTLPSQRSPSFSTMYGIRTRSSLLERQVTYPVVEHGILSSLT